MRRVHNARRGNNRIVGNGVKVNRRCGLAAAAVLSLSSAALAQTTLYLDANGTSAGFGSGTATWNTDTTSDWNTDSTGVAASGTWLQAGQTAGVDDFNIANFNGSAALTATVTGTVDVGGINFNAIASNVITGSGTLNLGSNNVTITNNVSSGQNILVPITGSGTLTIAYTGTGGQGQDMNLLGSLTGFTGTLVVATDSQGSVGNLNYTQLAIGSDLGSGATIQLQAYSQLTTENPTKNSVTGLDQLPAFTLNAPITLNPANAANSQEWIGAANGGNYGTSYPSTTMQSIMTINGVISGGGPSNTLFFGYGNNGGRGTVVLNNNETYTGNTYIDLGGNNGLVQLGVDNALPSGTVLSFGPNTANGTSTSAVAPLDLNGHLMTIAGLATTSTYTSTAAGSPSAAAASTIGNIYNTSGNAASIVIAGSTNTTYKGDIGDSNIAVNPFNDMYPYNGNTTANTNVSLTINGPGVLTLAPQVISSVTSTAINYMSDEYSGNTTVNGGGLTLGGTNVYGGFGTAPAQLSNGQYYYTLSSPNNYVTINSGATLSSLPTTYSGAASTYVGGAAGTIELKSGSLFTPGGAGTAGVFLTNNLVFDSGAAMTFDLVNANTYDALFVNSLTLDSSGPDHTININIPSGDTASPGIFTLIYTNGINYDGVNGFMLGSTPNNGDTFSLINTGYLLQLQVLAPALQWDPYQTGTTNVPNGQTITEGPGEWTDGTGQDGVTTPSTFYNYANNTETPWSNSATSQVIFGNDVNQSGATVTLGSNIVVNSLLTFGQIAPGTYYDLAPNGSYVTTLTLGGGISVNNSASVSGSPSAKIDVPVVLAGSQAWEVDPGQVLVVTGTVTENDGTPSYTLSKTGAGELDLDAASGSIGALNVAGGAVVLGTMNSIGSAPVTLNGGGLIFASTGTFANTFNASGTSGFGIGVIDNGTATVTQGITSTGPMALISNGITSGSLILNGNIAATSLTNETLGTTTFNGSATFSGKITNTTTGGRIYFNGNTTASSITTTAGTTLLAAGATDSFTNGLNITAGTLVVGSASDVGVTATNLTGNAINFTPATSNAGTLNLGGVTSLPNNISTGSSSDTQYGSTITTWPFSGPAVSVPITLSGNISGGGNITLMGTDFTLSGNNTFGPPSGPGGAGGALTLGNTGTYAGDPMTIHADSATAFGTAGITVNVAGVTLDIQTDVTANAIKGNALITKIGSGTLDFTGKTATGPSGNQLGYDIQTGAIEISSINGLGGDSAATIVSATAPSQGKLTVDPTGSLLVNTNGNDYTGTVTMAGGSIVRLLNAANAGDYNLTTYYTDTSASPAADTHNSVMNVTASSLIDNQDQAVAGSSHNLVIQMPTTVSTGATLTLESDNTAGNYEQAAVVLNGVSNNSTYQYNNLTLQAGSSVLATGAGDVDLGSTSAGDPIIAMGTPGSDAVMQLGAHTFLTDSGATAQNQGTSDMTRLIVDGSGNAGLRIEAPMDATYAIPDAGGAPALQTYEGTTGLTGVNTTGTAAAGTTPAGYATIGNGFTVLSPARAAALSNTYTLSDGVTVISPAGTLTLAATDANGATGLINAGPATPSNVSLALDNTSASTSGTLVYQIDPGANGQSFGNFAGLTVERTYSDNAHVTAQLLGTTKVPALSITGGAEVDITNQALVVDPATGPAPTSLIAGYLATAYDSGAWDLGGIGSSDISLLPGTSIGYVENDALATPYTNFGGQSVDNNAVLVKYTWLGDLNLDGTVDSSDLAMMGNVPTTGPEANVIGWFDGDLNYDGKINADDWSLFFLGDAAYNASGRTLASAVPEPAMSGMLMLALTALGARRRRR